MIFTVKDFRATVSYVCSGCGKIAATSFAPKDVMISSDLTPGTVSLGTICYMIVRCPGCKTKSKIILKED